MISLLTTKGNQGKEDQGRSSKNRESWKLLSKADVTTNEQETQERSTPISSSLFQERAPPHRHRKTGRELRNIYHHHPESKKGKSLEGFSGSIHLYSRHGNAGKTSKTISTIAILWPVKAIFENRAATVEVDTLISPVEDPRVAIHFQKDAL